MLNSDNFSYVVHKVLEQVGVKDANIIKLVKGTIAAESDLCDFIDHDNKTYGFPMIPKSYLREYINQYVRNNENFRKRFENITGISVKDTEDRLQFKLETDLAFQILLTYAVYRARYLRAPVGSMEELSRYYAMYWKGDLGVEGNQQHFIDSYNKHFSKA